MERRKVTDRRKNSLPVSHVDRRKVESRRQAFERRQNFRIPVIDDLARQIELRFFPSTVETSIPAIITQLSSGGMSLVAFFPVVNKERLPSVIVDLPALQIGPVEGKIVWYSEKNSSCLMGVRFIRISSKDTEKINAMAYDYIDCETKLSLGVKDVCFEKCHYKILCTKPEKE